jgi:hypothetical protein
MAFNPLPGVRYRIQSVGSHTFIGIRDVNSSALAMLPDNEEDDRQQVHESRSYFDLLSY